MKKPKAIVRKLNDLVATREQLQNEIAALRSRNSELVKQNTELANVAQYLQLRLETHLKGLPKE